MGTGQSGESSGQSSWEVSPGKNGEIIRFVKSLLTCLIGSLSQGAQRPWVMGSTFRRTLKILI